MKHPGDLLSADTTAKLQRHVQLLLRWNRRINLVSRGDEPSIWSRHVLDCVQLVPLLPPSATEFIDLGSGGGFPGLVIALVSQCHVHLVESDQRKAAFLREAIRETGANAEVHCGRAETLRTSPKPAVTARALAPVIALLKLAAPLLTPDGVCLLPKGQHANDELTEASREWHMNVERFPSRTSPGATILRISEIRRAGHSS